MKTPHKHAEYIKAWADGAKIEKQANTGEWFIDYKPDWHEDGYYRIFQESKPNVISYVYADKGKWMTFSETHHKDHNLKLTFDSETGKLKEAEVIA